MFVFACLQLAAADSSSSYRCWWPADVVVRCVVTNDDDDDVTVSSTSALASAFGVTVAVVVVAAVVAVAVAVGTAVNSFCHFFNSAERSGGVEVALEIDGSAPVKEAMNGHSTVFRGKTVTRRRRRGRGRAGEASSQRALESLRWYMNVCMHSQKRRQPSAATS